MLSTLSAAELAGYLKRQLGNMFPDGADVRLDSVAVRALQRTEVCFEPVLLPMYRSAGRTFFNHLHSDQYATFLYFASNEAWRDGDLTLAAKIYSLNKALNGFMCMYDTLLPEHFLIVHTVGMLLGKAEYGDYFVAIHDVTVGTDRGVNPRFGDHVVAYGGASIIGNSAIANDVSISAGTTIRNEAVPSDRVVFGTSPHLTIKPAKRQLIKEFFEI